MSLFNIEPKLPIAQRNKQAVLLMNLGTPDNTSKQAVRAYLQAFLSDQRVIELPKYLWQLILRGVILPFRAGKSAHAYQQIWTEHGSPLAVYTEKQTQALAQRLPNTLVHYAMTYGQPSVENVMAELKAQGVDELLVIPLYPQYAASSSGAALDKVFQVMLRQRNMMSLHTIRSFYQNPVYIQALANSVQRFWQQHGRAEKLLMSFHGIPEAHQQKGDPYPEECRQTAQLLAQALGLQEQDYLVAFQSQFGKGEWVKPSTQALLDQLPQQGVRSLDVICPAFIADCLETLEEISIAGQEQFLAAGGQAYRYIPCLNDDELWIDALVNMVQSAMPSAS